MTIPMNTIRICRGLTLLTVAVLAACGDSSTDVDARFALAAGTYTAEGGFGAMVLTTRTAGSIEETDWLAIGASFLISLREDGTTTGRLFVPGADEDGGDLDADMAGTWTVDGSAVRFEQDADTFVRDLPFTFDGGRLTGERTFGDHTVRTVLERR